MLHCECEECTWHQNGECYAPNARIVEGRCTEYGPEEEEDG